MAFKSGRKEMKMLCKDKNTYIAKENKNIYIESAFIRQWKKCDKGKKHQLDM